MRRLLLVSVFLYMLSFPNVSIWLFAFIALSPFFIVLERADSFWKHMVAGFAWGGLVAIGMGFWLFYAMVFQYDVSIMKASFFMLFLLAFPIGLLYALFGAAYGFLKRDSIPFYTIIVPSLWIIVDFLRELIPVLVPWGFLGYALVPQKLYVQFADISGIYGVTYLIVVINALVTFLFTGSQVVLKHGIPNASIEAHEKRIFKSRRMALIILLFAVILPVIYGALRRYVVDRSIDQAIEAGMKVKVQIAQGNFNNRDRWSGSSFFTRLQTYLGMSRKAPHAESEPVVTVWPETVLDASGMVDSDLFTHIISQIEEDSIIIAGGVRRATGSPGGLYNTAFLLSGTGDVSYYDKNILLPYAETSPFGLELGDFFRAPTAFRPGKTQNRIETPLGTAGLSICFEAIYPHYIRKSVDEGADFLVNISNDAWFGWWNEPSLHLRSAIVRAIETRRFLLRASNSGISAIVAPTGEIQARTELFSREKITGNIVLTDYRTFYTVVGDWVLYWAVLSILGGLLWEVFRGRSERED